MTLFTIFDHGKSADYSVANDIAFFLPDMISEHVDPIYHFRSWNSVDHSVTKDIWLFLPDMISEHIALLQYQHTLS